MSKVRIPSVCGACHAPCAMLRTSLGKWVACERATVGEEEETFVRGRHVEHACAAPPAPAKPTGQRGLFGGEE